jgi:hypothetical protein
MQCKNICPLVYHILNYWVKGFSGPGVCGGGPRTPQITGPPRQFLETPGLRDEIGSRLWYDLTNSSPFGEIK